MCAYTICIDSYYNNYISAICQYYKYDNMHKTKTYISVIIFINNLYTHIHSFITDFAFVDLTGYYECNFNERLV